MMAAHPAGASSLMMNRLSLISRAHGIHGVATLALVAGLAVGGCRGDEAPGESDTAASSTTSDGTDSASSTSDGETTTTTTTTTSTTTDPGTTDNSGGFLSSSTSASTGSMPQPNGSQCESDAECMSMHCYMIPMFGGVCSECKVDQDCLDSGAGIACSLDAGSMQAICTDGGIGSTCMSQESCMDGLTCAEVIPGTFGLVPSACSECAEDGECTDGKLCNPTFDIGELKGYKSCVEPGSVPNNELCDAMGSGDMACMSTHCEAVNAFGFVTVGVCGECESDDHCMGGTCTPGMVSMQGVMGSTCN